MKVLAIDDNKEITDMLSLYFESQGIEFTAINEGMQGLEAIRNEDPNIILLDLAMPNFSGLDVVDYLNIIMIYFPITMAEKEWELGNK